MTLSDISIKRPVFAWMLMAGLLVFGAISYLRLGISQLPDVDFPVVNITVTWAGASPDVMEAAVADVIEDSVMSVDGIQLVQSSSQQGQTQITIQFKLGTDINAALEQVQTKIASAQRNLPQTIDPPVITKTNPNDQPILWAAAYSESGRSLRDLNVYVRDELRDRITTVSGVGDILLGGFVYPQMRVWLDPRKMKSLEITAQDVIDAINNQHQIAPTGYQDSGDREKFVRVHSEFATAQECSDLVLQQRAGTPIWKTIRIRDVGHCEEGTDEIRRISRFNGIQPTVGLGVIKQRGTNAVEIGDTVRERLKQLTETLPPGIKIGIANDTTDFIRSSIHELVQTIAIAVLLTALVCYFFLGSLSSAFNVILAIPVSLVGALIILQAFNFTLNTFTLMALSLSIGIVVDDAIMVLENITRHVERGQNRVLGSILGAREITGAATAASLAILAIFVPVVFMPGIVGKFFFQFGIALSVAVLLSLLEALTLAPMRCSQFLEVGKRNRITGWVETGLVHLTRIYQRTLTRALHHRWKILITAMIVFAVSFALIPLLRKEFLPPQDQSRFLVTLRTPMGSSLAFTDQVFRKAEAWLKERKEVEKYYVAVGGFGGGLVNQGISFVTLKDKGDRPFGPPFKKKPSQQEFMAFAREEFKKIPGVQNVSILDLSLVGFSAQRGYPIEFVLQGPDWEKLTGIAQEMRQKLAEAKVMADVDSDYNPNMPETEVYPDRVVSAQRGVPIATIGSTVAATVGGLKLLPNKYTDASGHRDDIQVKLLPLDNQGPQDIAEVQVRNIHGEVLPLKEVVSMKDAATLLTITRYNRERGITIFGNFPPGKSQSETLDAIQKIGKEILPKGYHLTLSGSSQAFGESFSSLVFAFVLGLFVAYAVLASQFNSFLHPVIILLALPFSLTGALIAMKITDTSLNIYSMIGILLLMGIVKKNSILLVEFTNHKRQEGLDVEPALLEACPIRLRPILMTSIATITAAIPQALSSGSGAELIRPMSIAVIGGVAVSTFLTLFVVPCAYSLASRLEGTKNRKMLQEALGELRTLEAQGVPAVAAADVGMRPAAALTGDGIDRGSGGSAPARPASPPSR